MIALAGSRCSAPRRSRVRAWRRARARGGALGRGAALARRRRRARGSRRAVAVAPARARGVALRGADAAPLRPGELVVSFLDVGQGDATLIQLGATAVLVDTGPPDGPILKRLEQAHVKRLDALFLTHAEADHEGAAPAVIREYAPRLVVDGGAGWNSPVQRALPTALAASRTRASRRRPARRSRSAACASRSCGRRRATAHEGNPNDHAIVTRLTYGPFSMLLTADAESNVTPPLDLAPVDVLKVAHHGSADAGLPALLDRLRPRLAAIEVGRDNSYGHPTKSTLGGAERTRADGRAHRPRTARSACASAAIGCGCSDESARTRREPRRTVHAQRASGLHRGHGTVTHRARSDDTFAAVSLDSLAERTPEP